MCHSYTQDQYGISKLSQEVDFVSYCQAPAKKSCQKLKLDRDSTMAVKGFDIKEDLTKIGLKLNSPPFLKQKPQFNENEVIRTQLLQTQDS